MWCWYGLFYFGKINGTSSGIVMTFNREEWVAEMTRIKEMDIPVLDGEEVQASELIDEENNKIKEK